MTLDIFAPQGTQHLFHSELTDVEGRHDEDGSEGREQGHDRHRQSGRRPRSICRSLLHRHQGNTISILSPINL